MKKKKSVKKKRKTTKKKVVKKKVSSKNAKSPRLPKGSVKGIKIQMQPILTQNFVALQKVMLTLSEKIDKLTNQTARLLDLFEISAKALAKEEYKPMPSFPAKKPIAPPMVKKPLSPGGKPIPMIPPSKPMQSKGYQKSASQPKQSK